MAKAPKISTDSVIYALSLAHPPDKWAFFEELRIGTGFSKDSKQRIDAVAISYYRANAQCIRTFEVKVSRSDFLSEMKKPLKRRAAHRIANEFFFVCPKGMISVEELPVECGLIEVTEDGQVETTVPAPYFKEVYITKNLLSAVARRVDRDRSEPWQRAEKAMNDFVKSLDMDVVGLAIEKRIKKWEGYVSGDLTKAELVMKELKALARDIEEIKQHRSEEFDNLFGEL